MAYLSQASSPVADFSKFVISFMGRWPSTDSFPPGFLEFGQTTNGPCFIGLNGDGSFGSSLVGTHNAYIPVFGGVPQAGRTVQADFNTASSSVVSNAWTRFILSCDFTTGAEFTYNGTPGSFTFVSNGFRVWASINDTDYSPTSFNGPGTLVVSGQPPGSFMPNAGGLSNTADVSLPGFTVAINGFEFSIPCLAAHADPSYNPKFQMADPIMWTGVSLDTSNSTNRRLFIDADGNPVNPSVAIAALGTPVYYFSGQAASWSTNRGSAGSVTKTGTISDFTPGP